MIFETRKKMSGMPTPEEAIQRMKDREERAVEMLRDGLEPNCIIPVGYDIMKCAARMVHCICKHWSKEFGVFRDANPSQNWIWKINQCCGRCLSVHSVIKTVDGEHFSIHCAREDEESRWLVFIVCPNHSQLVEEIEKHLTTEEEHLN